MCTTHLETVHASVSVATTRCHSYRSQNEQFWKDLQWSPLDIINGGDLSKSDIQGVPYLTFPGGYPTIWPIPWCIWCYLLPLRREKTHTCENITLPQLRWRAVKNNNTSTTFSSIKLISTLVLCYLVVKDSNNKCSNTGSKVWIYGNIILKKIALKGVKGYQCLGNIYFNNLHLIHFLFDTYVRHILAFLPRKLLSVCFLENNTFDASQAVHPR